ncbi:CesT family type III secretion system chaperone [Sungkyunkwania multivorans]|uniref:CesT family type III secretion system chaperone n=1 Tax=Sungkyunkwania multivorans TaxID=1173618 RepID=A0ABW3CX62_9FLAO
MKDHFRIIKDHLKKLHFEIAQEDAKQGIMIIKKDEEAIHNLVLGINEPLLIFEQYLFKIVKDHELIYKNLLIKNRDILHGAFALDRSGQKVIFRDTLQLENLDLNELEGTLNALSLLLSEYQDKISEFSKH